MTRLQETVDPVPRAAPPYSGAMAKFDAELLPRLFAGEEQAYRALISANHRAMLAVARAGGGPAAAEVIAQEAWNKAISALPTFDGRSPLRIWLLRIAHRVAISRSSSPKSPARARKTESIYGDALANRFNPDGSWRLPPSAWSLDTPETLLAVAELRSAIDEALAAMPEMQRAVIALKDIEGLSLGDICNVLDILASDARALLRRARQSLWAALDRHHKLLRRSH